MRKSRIGLAIIGVLIAAISISSCTYGSYHRPGYDYGYNSGYGYGYRYAPPPPRIIVRPAPRLRVYRDYGRSRHYNDRRSNRNYNRQSQRQYGHNGRGNGVR